MGRGGASVYASRHPTPKDLGVLIEIGDSTVLDDRRYKGELYAKEKVPEFWLANLPQAKVEVYTKPRGAKYLKKSEYAESDSVPLVLDGVRVGEIPVRDLIAR